MIAEGEKMVKKLTVSTDTLTFYTDYNILICNMKL